MNKQIDIVVDQSYGDTGKGRCIDLISNEYDVIARYNGGSNSGRVVYHNDKRIVFSQVPSGALNPNVKLIIGNGCVLNISKLREEIQNLESLGISVRNRLFISNKAHIVQQKHIDEDSINELSIDAVGSTKQGIMPCYKNKVERKGFQLGMFESLFKEDLNLSVRTMNSYDFIAPMICDTSNLLHKYLKEGKKILCEGAQGTFLDIDHGTYPYVTSSNCLSGAATTGLGFGPNLVGKVIGITKAYTTRVGSGPFVTELPTDSGPGKTIASEGHEYGSITGRPRRIGWLNLVELKKAIQLNGCSEIILTKLDVLSTLNNIEICVKYDNDYVATYKTLPGWEKDISQCKKWWDLPENAVKYVNFIEDEIGVKITRISVGPERNQIIRKY